MASNVRQSRSSAGDYNSLTEGMSYNGINCPHVIYSAFHLVHLHARLNICNLFTSCNQQTQKTTKKPIVSQGPLLLDATTNCDPISRWRWWWRRICSTPYTLIWRSPSSKMFSWVHWASKHWTRKIQTTTDFIWMAVIIITKDRNGFIQPVSGEKVRRKWLWRTMMDLRPTFLR